MLIHTIRLESGQSACSCCTDMSPQRFSVQQLAAIALLLDEEEERVIDKRKRVWVHKRQMKRKSKGEFWTLYKELQDDELKFYQYFSMTKSQFNYLLQKIEGDLIKSDTCFREAVSPRERLAVCLRFLTTGDSFRTIAFSYRLGHSTVHSIVKQVCASIIKRLKSVVMPKPTEETWKNIAEEFWDLWNFPNCVGAIDGKHVRLKAPPKYESTFSIVFLALVDANSKFVVVDIGSYSNDSDGGIFSHSKLSEQLETGALNIPSVTQLPNSSCTAPYVIVGDEAFPLKTYLLRPYSGLQSNNSAEKRLFNYRLSRARRVVENAFGMMSQKFRVYQKTLNLLPGNADNVIFATCILHNYLCANATDVRSMNVTNNARNSLVDIARQGGNAPQGAFLVREKFKEFLNSPPGSLPLA